MAAHLMVGLAPDHDVTAVGMYPGSAGPVEERLKEASVEVRYLGKRRGIDLRMFSALDRVTREIKPHVVHTHLSVLRYMLPVLRRCGVPLAVHTLHNAAERESDTVGRFVQRIAFRGTVIPVAISQHGAASFARVYGRECLAVIPNSIPIEDYERPADARERWRAQQGFTPDAIVFCCVGRLEPQKNPLALLAAFADLHNHRAHLVLIGDGSLRPQVMAFIHANRLDRHVHVLGIRHDIPDCLAGSDVFVLASSWEGNPLAVMEAMAAGLPVVSTAVGGVPELIEKGRDGFLVDPKQSSGLTFAMGTLADDPDRRRVIGAAAKATARAKFGVRTMIGEYASLYRFLLDAARSGSPAQFEPWEAGQTYATRTAGDKRP